MGGGYIVREEGKDAGGDIPFHESMTHYLCMFVVSICLYINLSTFSYQQSTYQSSLIERV